MPDRVPRPQTPRSLARRLLPLVALVVLAVLAYVLFAAVAASRSSPWCATARRSTTSSLSIGRLAVLAYIGALYCRRGALGAGSRLPDRSRAAFCSGLWSAPRPRLSAQPSAPHSFFWWLGRRSASRCCAGRAARATSWRRAFARMLSAICCFCAWCRLFPFFLVNLVPALAGVRLGPFVAATALGIIPGAIVFALAGTGLDSVIAAQKNAYDECIAARPYGLSSGFDPSGCPDATADRARWSRSGCWRWCRSW